MYIHELTIEMFRGIRSLECRFGPGLSAIVGPGDYGKTTILDALALLFHPHWALNLTDNDFFGTGEPTAPIIIRATVANPPEVLTADGVFFSHLRGIDTARGLVVDEPSDHIPALTCELKVDTDFEPTWAIVCDRHDKPLSLSASNRRRLGVRRIESTTSHLRWTPNSALHQLSDRDDSTSTDTVLRDVSREARVAARTKLTAFADAITDVTQNARTLRAISDTATLSAELDADLAGMTRGSISLHVDELPISRSGLGTRRLASVAVQTVAGSGANVLLIDEVESGLEPHRTRHLIRFLHRTAVDGERQILVTTHSPTVLRELAHDRLAICRRAPDGAARLLRAPIESQGVLRSHAEAFLAPRVLVCEGATEVGFVREVCTQFERGDPSRQSLMAPVDAGGDSKMVNLANRLHALGYVVGVFCDYDNDQLDLSGLDAGVILIQCEEGNAIEQQVLSSLTLAGARVVLDYGIECAGTASVRSRLNTAGMASEDVEALMSSGNPFEVTMLQSTRPIADAAKAGEWFKQIARGEDLARIVSNA